ncbi:MAG: M14 family metallopeptidase [Bacteroidota bacterium]
MKRFPILLLLFAPIFSFGQVKNDSLITLFEQSNYLETPTYKATIDYCDRLVNGSKMINMVSIGKSARGNNIPIMIVDKNGFTSAKSIRKTGRAIIFIQACVHSGEPDGKDAGLMLIRDLVFRNKNTEILNNLSIVFLPIFNVDGHERWGAYNRINQNGPKEMGWRTTASNYNLNRDYLKADAIEMKNWIAMYNKWEPDFLFDCHTTDGADYQYAITYSLETSGNLDESITKWLSNKYIKEIEPKMTLMGYSIFPYVIFRNWHDPRSGLINYASPLKLLNGYAAARNRACMLIETHMLKSYQTRVFATYHILMESLKLFSNQKEELLNLNQKADEYILSKQFKQQPFVIKYTISGDSDMVVFKGVHYDVIKSDVTQGDWFVYDSTRKEDFITPYFKKLKPQSIINIPSGYVIPPEIEFIKPLLELHNIYYFKIKEDVSVKGEVLRFKSVKLSSTSNEGRQSVIEQSNTLSQEQILVPKGSIVVPINQKTAKVILNMFEPDSPDSFLQWGFFNIIFEQKEYTESYVMEKMMREMMEKDSVLKAEFTNKYNSDSLFRQNQREIYNWFYLRTPYWDQKLNVYPIIRIPEEITIDLLRTYKRNSILD